MGAPPILKVEIYSLPYSAINVWGSENAGKLLDLDAEIELWRRAGHIKVNLKKRVDVRRIDRLIADAVLGNLREGGPTKGYGPM